MQRIKVNSLCDSQITLFKVMRKRRRARAVICRTTSTATKTMMTTSHTKTISATLQPQSVKKVSILLKMAQFTVVSGLIASVMVLASRLGLMERGMKENGATIKLMDVVSFIMLMEISLMESGAMTRPMVTAHIST